MAFLFPVSLRGTHFAAGPRSLASPGSSSRELLLLFRVRTAPNLPRTHVRGRLPWGSTPHRDISTESPLASEHPKLTLRSVLGVSHALDGLLLSLPCGFISPRSHVRDSRLRGFFPATRPIRLVGVPYPLVVRGVLLPPSCLDSSRSRRSPTGSSSGQRSEVTDRLFRPAAASIPSHVSTPSGFSSNTLGAPSRPLRSAP